MPKDPQYLSFNDVVGIHDLLIQQTGDLPGFMGGEFGRGRVDAAVNRPQWDYYNHLFLKAAVLIESLANNHGFVSANKRTALEAGDTFLRLNGYYLKLDADESLEFIKGNMAAGTFTQDVIAGWILKFREKSE
jgi:death-on-curing protein